MYRSFFESKVGGANAPTTTKGTSLKTLPLILSLLVATVAYGAESAENTWNGTLVIDWGDSDTPPVIALLHGDKVTDQTLSSATRVEGEAFVWKNERVPGVWVFYLPDGMNETYISIALVTPIQLPGAASTVFRTKESVMMTKIEIAPHKFGRRAKIFCANGVVGNLYKINVDKMKCFGLPKECEQLEVDVASAARKTAGQ